MTRRHTHVVAGLVARVALLDDAPDRDTLGAEWFYADLADLVGDAISCSVSSAVSAAVSGAFEAGRADGHSTGYQQGWRAALTPTTPASADGWDSQ